MVKKIFFVRAKLHHINMGGYTAASKISYIYLELLGAIPKVAWKGTMFHNKARPKAIFSIWLQFHGRC